MGRRAEAADLISGSFAGGFNQDRRAEANAPTYVQGTEMDARCFGVSYHWLLGGSAPNTEAWM